MNFNNINKITEYIYTMLTYDKKNKKAYLFYYDFCWYTINFYDNIVLATNKNGIKCNYCNYIRYTNSGPCVNSDCYNRSFDDFEFKYYYKKNGKHKISKYNKLYDNKKNIYEYYKCNYKKNNNVLLYKKDIELDFTNDLSKILNATYNNYKKIVQDEFPKINIGQNKNVQEMVLTNKIEINDKDCVNINNNKDKSIYGKYEKENITPKVDNTLNIHDVSEIKNRKKIKSSILKISKKRIIRKKLYNKYFKIIKCKNSCYNPFSYIINIKLPIIQKNDMLNNINIVHNVNNSLNDKKVNTAILPLNLQ